MNVGTEYIPHSNEVSLTITLAFHVFKLEFWGTKTVTVRHLAPQMRG
jgi:hypothetical protein